MKIAINGFGRIGRNIFRASHENYAGEFEIVAINDLADPKVLLHLLEHDSVHGKFHFSYELKDNKLIVDGKEILLLQERDPKNLPWGQLGVDIVHECTGFFASKDKANSHLVAGAKKVLISAPAGSDVDATIVYGVNDNILTSKDTIVSNASCTTNCLAPLVLPLEQEFGIESGLMTTIHAYTSDQSLTDMAHSDLRRARAANLSMIPTKTGAAAAIKHVIPKLAGKLDGFALRVPTANVSVVDLTFESSKPATIESVNEVLRAASLGKLRGVLAINELPLVSIDFNHNPASSIADLTQTRVIGNTVKVLAWYDNEWGFANRMLDTSKAMMNA